jgi:cyanophycin synthetase
VEAVPRDGFAVLNADEELVRAMRLRCAGRIVWFTMAEPGSEIRDSVDDHLSSRVAEWWRWSTAILAT